MMRETDRCSKCADHEIRQFRWPLVRRHRRTGVYGADRPFTSRRVVDGIFGILPSPVLESGLWRDWGRVLTAAPRWLKRRLWAESGESVVEGTVEGGVGGDHP